jgi:hypothetical protein
MGPHPLGLAVKFQERPQDSPYNKQTMKPKQHPKKQPSNISQLSRDTGISRDTLQRWKSEGTDIFKPQELAAKVAAMPAQGGGSGLVEARLRKLTAEADRIELQLARERGELLPAGEVEASAIQVCSATRAALLSLTNSLPPKLAGLNEGKILNVLRTEFFRILRDLSDGRFFDSPVVAEIIATAKRECGAK